ncbi:hypothetical protein TNCV_1742601 [Trichonephila clavipes]|nr:hypothetical protein TNCV_1742601 [Trichonephila clavipes]
MDWPARSPDLNPIEHVWDFLGRRLAARTLPPVTIRELRLALQDEWAAMPQQLIDTLILSMGRRCETCLAYGGGYTLQSKNVLVHRGAGTTRSGVQWMVLLAATPGKVRNLHTCWFLQSYHAAQTPHIRLATPLACVTVLLMAIFIASLTN